MRIVVATTILALVLGSVTVAAAEDKAPTTDAQASVDTTDGTDEQPMTFAFEPAEERSFAGWTEVGRAAGGGYLHRLRMLDGRLLAAGKWRPAGEDFVRADRAWYSDDGWTWTAAELPGRTPRVSDLAVRPDGSMAVAVGYTENDWKGAVWITKDGVDWQAAAPPSKHLVDWVAASDEVVIVSAGSRLWTTTDLENWSRVKGPRPLEVAYGPGGFLTVEGGGQDRISKTAMWHSADGSEWSKVKLPKALRDVSVGVLAFPLDDEWLLLPDKRGLMYRSTDGSRWRKVPRPPDMTVGYVWWVAEVGEAVHANGSLFDRKKHRLGLWTFMPGERVARAKLTPNGFVGVNAPVERDGGYVGYGHQYVDGDGEFLTMWRWSPEDPAIEHLGSEASG